MGKNKLTGGDIIIKINNEMESHEIECEVLQKLTEKRFKNFPMLIKFGM